MERMESRNEYMGLLTEEIVAYVKDEKHNYAIALEGDWGSGKTRYLEKVVKPRLEKEGFSMVRVSLFGVKSPEDLCDRMVGFLFRLNSTGDNSTGRVKMGVKQVLSGLAKDGLSNAGLPLSINASAKMIVDVWLRKDKHLLVFDDLERRGETDDDAIFGAINDFVENRGFKTIFVTNTIAKDGQSPEKALDSSVREKLVWRVLRFSPSPAILANEIFGTFDVGIEGFDCRRVVEEAAERAQCRNARAMLKADILVKRLFGLGFVCDDSIALGNKESALIDAIEFSLLICMESEPSKPSKPDPMDPMTPDFYAFIAAEERYEKCSDLSIIKDCLRSSSFVSDNDLDVGVRKYIAKRYPGSPDTVALSDIVKTLGRINELTDEDVERLIPSYKELIERALYSPSVLPDAIRFNYELKSIGFQSLFDDSSFVALAKKVVDANPESAFDTLRNGLAFSGGFTDEGKTVVKELRGYTEEAYAKAMPEMGIDIGAENCGQAVAECLREFWQRKPSLLLRCDPGQIAECFLSSNPQGQEAIRAFLLSVEAIYSPVARK